jgi:hypothetical protein
MFNIEPDTILSIPYSLENFKRPVFIIYSPLLINILESLVNIGVDKIKLLSGALIL